MFWDGWGVFTWLTSRTLQLSAKACVRSIVETLGPLFVPLRRTCGYPVVMAKACAAKQLVTELEGSGTFAFIFF